jgi:hypothetical protein
LRLFSRIALALGHSQAASRNGCFDLLRLVVKPGGLRERQRLSKLTEKIWVGEFLLD